jgi:hypothetical protein
VNSSQLPSASYQLMFMTSLRVRKTVIVKLEAGSGKLETDTIQC